MQCDSTGNFTATPTRKNSNLSYSSVSLLFPWLSFQRLNLLKSTGYVMHQQV